MVAARDVGNVLDIFGPRNLVQEVVGVDHVGLNLFALIRIEAAFGDGEEPHLLRRQVGPFDSARVHVAELGHLNQPVEVAFRQHRRLVRFQNETHVVFQFAQAAFIFRIELREGVHGRAFFHRPEFLPQDVGFEGFPDEIETVLNDGELLGIEFLGLDQHFFPDADFAEVMQ